MSGLALHALRVNSANLTSKLIYSNKNRIHSSRWSILCNENKLLSSQEVSETLHYEAEEISLDESDGSQEKRNKSRLTPHHQNIVHGKPPYKEPMAPFHNTIKYRRRMFGRYGMESGVNPGVLWPTKEELQEKLEYEKVSHPDSLLVMVARAKLKSAQELENMKKREEEIDFKAAKLEQWKRELHQRTNKKLLEAQAAKEKKERLLEEVRQHFGFKLDSRDERFKELLEKKEKEESKRVKAEKKKVKEARLLERLTGAPNPAAQVVESPPPSDKVN